MSNKPGACPFCGSKSGPDVEVTFTYPCWIQCGKCGAEGPSGKDEAEAMAEARGKAQADTLRKTKSDAIANRLLQKAHNRDGLPEIAIGATFLTFALLEWLQVAFHPGSFLYKTVVVSLMLLFPAIILLSPWAIKQVRTRFLIEKVGYVKPKPLSWKLKGRMIGIVLVLAVAAIFAAYTGSFPSAGWVLAGTGIGGGFLLALSGRSPRFVVGGVAMAATGILFAFSGTSLEIGFTILYGSIGLLALISGCVVFFFFTHKPAASDEGE